MKFTRHLLVGAALLALPAFALATPVTLNNPSAGFSDLHWASGSNHCLHTRSNHGFTDNEVRFGIPSSASRCHRRDWRDQSGLEFDPFSAPLNTHTGDVFNLGTLIHYNNPVKTDTSIVGGELHVGFDITDPALGTQNFTFPFDFDETSNSGHAKDCPYPSDKPCSDAITFSPVQSTQTFTINGVDYTLKLLGFGSDADHIQQQFISQEGSENSTFLWAKIDTATPPPVRVPEPGSLLMLALGLLGLGGLAALRRRQRGHRA